MKGFKRCANGHFYKETLNACPHCAGGSGDLEKTAVNPGGGGGNFDKTQIFGQGAGGDAPTQVAGNSGGDATQVFAAGSGGGAGRDLNKTYIGGVTEENDGGEVTSAPRAARKITGYLISFTLDPMGEDFRLYEGTNTIGRDVSNSITITKDTTISGRHANILHKKGQFWISDEMAANGTYVNGVELEIQKATPIKDGDEIKLGDTVFIFKTWH